MGISFLRPFLQSLCCDSPWNYAVFWKLKHQDEMVLAWEDGVCDIPKPRDAIVSPVEDLYFKNLNMISSFTQSRNLLDETPGNYLLGSAVAEMSRASHVVGTGLVGEAAFKGNAHWIYSDSIQTDVLNSILASKYPDEWLLQFAAGIKTMLILPVIPDGVLQLGSMEMVGEDAALVAYVKNKFETQRESEFIQQYSLLFASMDDVEEPLTVATEQVIEDQNYIDHYLSEAHATETEADLRPMGTVHASEQRQLSYAEHEDEITNLYHYFELNPRMCRGMVNELMDFQFEDGMTEPIFVGSYFGNAICETESNLFNSPGVCELEEALSGTSILVQNVACHSIGEREPFSAMDVSRVESVVVNASSSVDDDSSEKSNVTSINISSSGFPKPGGIASLKEDQVSWDLSASVSSDESKISSLSDQQQNRKGHDFLKRGKLSTTCKKKSRTLPRDRQLIQDRIKELRELVPNSEKSSIDGLLDKTMKHMLFLTSVTNQADKLRHPILREEVDENTTKTAEVNYNHRDGTSWAVELGSEQHFCPIIVKDLDHPGHMVIQVVCTDHDRFLEITDVIHRLKLTILKGVMEKTSDNSSWARFIVETSGSFHRLDIFWPLVQLLRNDVN